MQTLWIYDICISNSQQDSKIWLPYQKDGFLFVFCFCVLGNRNAYVLSANVVNSLFLNLLM